MHTNSAFVSIIVLATLGYFALEGLAATGSIRYHQFNDIVGESIPRLTNSAKFPNYPDRIEYVTKFENPEEGGDNFSAYGAQFVGFVHPPVSGEYRFFIASDDQSLLYLSTDANAANKVLIAREPHWAGFREWTGNAGGRRDECIGGICENVSPFILLENGRKYFIEFLYTEDGGDDHGSVAWQLPGGPVPLNGSAPIAGQFLSPYDIAASIPADEPRDITTLEGRRTTFSANITGSPSLSIQWYRDGQAIPGATGFSFSIQPLGCHSGDNGSTFYVVASNSLGVATSRVATLTVLEDASPPRAISASASSTFDRVVVAFDEIMDATSLADVFNYVILDAQQNELRIGMGQTNYDGASVTLFLEPATPMQSNHVYTVTVSGVSDLCGNEIFTDTIQFQSFVEGCGGLIFEAFNMRGEIDMDAVISAFAFPSNLFFRSLINGFDSRLAFPDDSHVNYGGRIRGLYVPPYSGHWKFYLRSDDTSRLWLNPNGPDADGKQLVQEETSCCSTFEGHPTVAFPLIGGRAYYIEAVYREFGSIDYCQVAARLEGNSEPLIPIGLRDLGQFALPGGAGHITIVRQPQNQTVLENSLATFSVLATNDYRGPICYQWMRDGVEIIGATGPSYSVRPSICDFEHAVFTVKLSIPGDTAFSSAAVLTVTEDASPPHVLWARGSDSLRKIHVQFDDLLDDTSAGDEFNYVVADANGNRLTVEDAARNADWTSVTLRTGLQAPGMMYTVTVNGVTDIACRPHTVIEGTASFTAFVLLARIALSSNTVNLSWNSQTGRLYQIQFTENLHSNWTNLVGDVLATGTNTTVSQPLNSGLPGRFYRIQVADPP